MLYSDVEKLKPEPKTDQSRDSLGSNPGARYPSPEPGAIEEEGEELHFKNGELLNFHHDCLPINRVPTDVLKKLKQDQGRNNPELSAGTPVQGRLVGPFSFLLLVLCVSFVRRCVYSFKVLGVFLIANEEGLNQPEMAWFKGPDLDYFKSKDKTVKDSSFVLSGHNNLSYCIQISDGTTVKLRLQGSTSTTDKLQVCSWQPKEEDKPWYAQVFQRGFDSNGARNGEPTLSETDYKFIECPDPNPDRDIILTMATKPPEPVAHINYTEFDPFSFINPNVNRIQPKIL